MNKIKHGLVVGLVAGWMGAAAAAPSIEVTPAVFDFGWTPDNAIVSCEFLVRNTTAEMVPLSSVQPSCGCTATDFTPENLAGAAEKKINITFNTRGYSGLQFNKSVNVRAGAPLQDVIVHVKGFVTDSKAVVRPDGDGVVVYEPGSHREKKVTILNQSSATISLSVVQAPASWVRLEIPKAKIDPNESGVVEVKASGSFDEIRHTSFSLDAIGPSEKSRMTVAIRTGAAPQPYRRIRTAPKGPSPSPTPDGLIKPTPQ